ncbi:MAG: hypothetical protein ABSG50_15685 [Opitutaceae bacterium]|jgi:hypothetical protein
MNDPLLCSLVRVARLLAASFAAASALSGCVTRGYKLAPKDTPGPTLLKLSAAQPPVEATLHTVIIFQGPGSWKREAYWDEYVLTVANRGETPAIIDSAMLYGSQSEPVTPGDNPWTLEKLSKKWWQTNAARQTGTYLALGAGTAVGAGVALASAMGGIMAGPVSAGATAAGAVGAATVVALPLFAVGTVVANVHGKHKVEAEFRRRRLVLPLSIAPGQTVQGSLFFRITPGPQRLVLQCRADGETRPLAMDLALLAGLHLKPTPPAATAP